MNSSWINYGEYIVGIPLFILGALLTIWLSNKQKNKKELKYRIIANESLHSYDNNSEEDLIVSYGETKIENLTLLSIEFKNTGNKEITKADFDSNVIIKTGNENFVLNVRVEHSDNILVNFDLNHNKIEILPLLINSGVKFTLKILIDKKESFKPFIQGRIAGVKEIQEIKPVPFWIKYWINGFWIVMFASAITAIFPIIIDYFFSGFKQDWSHYLKYFIIFLSGLLSIMLLLFILFVKDFFKEKEI